MFECFYSSVDGKFDVSWCHPLLDRYYWSHRFSPQVYRTSHDCSRHFVNWNLPHESSYEVCRRALGSQYFVCLTSSVSIVGCCLFKTWNEKMPVFEMDRINVLQVLYAYHFFLQTNIVSSHWREAKIQFPLRKKPTNLKIYGYHSP